MTKRKMTRYCHRCPHNNTRSAACLTCEANDVPMRNCVSIDQYPELLQFLVAEEWAENRDRLFEAGDNPNRDKLVEIGEGAGRDRFRECMAEAEARLHDFFAAWLSLPRFDREVFVALLLCGGNVAEAVRRINSGSGFKDSVSRDQVSRARTRLKAQQIFAKALGACAGTPCGAGGG